jgi:hypothetical protein
MDYDFAEKQKFVYFMDSVVLGNSKLAEKWECHGRHKLAEPAASGQRANDAGRAYLFRWRNSD